LDCTFRASPPRHTNSVPTPKFQTLRFGRETVFHPAQSQKFLSQILGFDSDPTPHDFCWARSVPKDALGNRLAQTTCYSKRVECDGGQGRSFRSFALASLLQRNAPAPFAYCSRIYFALLKKSSRLVSPRAHYARLPPSVIPPGFRYRDARLHLPPGMEMQASTSRPPLGMERQTQLRVKRAEQGSRLDRR
jgi:hypothetical protein